jgi:hypothetical protein
MYFKDCKMDLINRNTEIINLLTLKKILYDVPRFYYLQF